MYIYIYICVCVYIYIYIYIYVYFRMYVKFARQDKQLKVYLTEYEVPLKFPLYLYVIEKVFFFFFFEFEKLEFLL